MVQISTPSKVYQLRLVQYGIRPMIQRRLLFVGETSVARLREYIQTARHALEHAVAHDPLDVTRHYYDLFQSAQQQKSDANSILHPAHAMLRNRQA